ncbi:Uncharacterized protein HZ326_24480 [Fusarium oxysporum f. sp. albedinis]|nr:Uncharacterized protein HZ326_24480 [Fusarium oxysporum f. sp. albedinis]
MNDVDLKDYGVLAVSEPYAKKIDGNVVTSPAGHSNWTRMIPTHTHDAPWPIRSMLWVRSDIEAEQVPIPSADLTAAVLRLPERDILMVSIDSVMAPVRVRTWCWLETSIAMTYSGPETRYQQEDKAKPSQSST